MKRILQRILFSCAALILAAFFASFARAENQRFVWQVNTHVTKNSYSLYHYVPPAPAHCYRGWVPARERSGSGMGSCYVSNADLNNYSRTMTKAGQEVVATSGGGCRSYGNGCRNCPGPVTSTRIRSPRGHTIAIQKGGQNHLQNSVVRVLKALADREGRDVLVTSGYRSCTYQHSTHQGVSHSQHLMGKAADFRFPGASYSSAHLASFARSTLAGIGLGGGTGIYCGGFSHVDTGPNRQWNWCQGYHRHRRYRRR
jgi:hypothetical protein